MANYWKSDQVKNKSYHHGNLKKALLARAIEIIQSEGTEKITLRRLGKDIGVSAMAAYRHFTSKEELLQTAAQQGFEALSEKLDKIRANNPKQKLIQQGVAYIQFALAHPAHYQLMFSFPNSPNSQPKLNEASQAAFEHLKQTVEECFASNKNTCSLDPLTATLVCWGQVHGAAGICLTGRLPDKLTIDKFATSAAENCVNGLLSN